MFRKKRHGATIGEYHERADAVPLHTANVRLGDPGADGRRSSRCDLELLR